MFYEPARRNHGVANLAPYSFFNMVSEQPDIVMFSSAGLKDTVRNVMATGAFVCNLATLELIEAVNLTSRPLPPDESEFDLAGLEQAPSRLVKPPRVAASPCALECVWIETLDVKDRHGAASGRHITFGEIVGVHIDDAFIEDGLVRTDRLHALARGGYFDYSWVDEVRSLPRPG